LEVVLHDPGENENLDCREKDRLVEVRTPPAFLKQMLARLREGGRFAMTPDLFVASFAPGMRTRVPARPPPGLPQPGAAAWIDWRATNGVFFIRHGRPGGQA
jgi:hypothetical protein